jgi:hypothetical protein
MAFMILTNLSSFLSNRKNPEARSGMDNKSMQRLARCFAERILALLR